MKTNGAVDRAVDDAVYMVVHGATARAVDVDVYRTVYGAVAVDRAVSWPMYRALHTAESSNPPHPALVDFLSDAQGAP